MMRILISLLAFTLTAAWRPALALEVAKHEDIVRLIDELVSEQRFSEQELRDIFARVRLRPNVVKVMSKPSERLPWHRYRKLFITPVQIDDGVDFWRAHDQTLQRAEQDFGVPAEVIVAIIGVETRYGRNRGSYPVIDSLTTLTLQYPRRSNFFRSELRHFLVLTRDEGLDPLGITGSYAGAIGIPQFMPSSYRDYAVDFSGNGRRDLVNETEDAIGSVANYLKRYRWQANAPIVADARTTATVAAPLIHKKLRPNTTVAALRKAGVKTADDVDGSLQAALVQLDGAESPIWRVAFANFYAITRYNPSVNYAMAVYELSVAVARRRAAD
jgi:membrane-bound lytic murein transglycosylase B